MINLITGQPGAGKTLYMITLVKGIAEKELRAVYYFGINGLNIPGWILLDRGEDWWKCPPNSIVVIDECQQIFRPRMHGKEVPEHVAKAETHRHSGIDLYMTTQHPMLLDPNMRRLTGNHKHIVRKFGMQKATVHEWFEVKEQADKPAARESSVRHDFSYPKDTFALYKSAEVHTHKRNIPMRVWFFLAIPFLIAGLVYWAYIKARPVAMMQPAAPANGINPAMQRADIQKPRTREEFLLDRTPRIQGLSYTAPVYDKVTAVVRAPAPHMCIASAARCQCYTEQSTRLEVTEFICRQFADGGYYHEFDTVPMARVFESQKVASAPVSSDGEQSPVVASPDRPAAALPVSSAPAFLVVRPDAAAARGSTGYVPPARR